VRGVLTWLLVLTTPAGLVWGDSFIQKNFHQLVVEAEQIFVGTVTASQSRKLPTGAIVTDVTFSSLRVLKGSEAPGDIVLTVLGGSVDGETLKVGGFPEFRLGVTYLIFSKDNGTAIFPVVGGAQGMFQIKRDPTTGEELVLDAHGMAITSPTVTDAISTSAPTPGLLQRASPVTLDAFVRAIKNRLSP
jgi:hypothetical protein